MLTTGLLGGMSWESSAAYYRLLNEGVKSRLGGLHSARCILYSLDFNEIERLQHTGDWTRTGAILVEAAQALERAGADILLLCTNTMHKLADEIQAAIGIPFLHIGDATAAAIKAAGLRRVALLGTRFTMEQDFYRQRLLDQGLEVLVPPAAQRETVHRIIYAELCQGRCEAASREAYRGIMAELVAAGAQGIILGCTEIGLLVDQQDASVPLFDTTRIHVEAALDRALEPTP